MSCDLLPTEKPGPHYQGDVFDIIKDGWDLMIAHPPCTYLCSSGLHWNKRRPGREEMTHEAVLFVMFQSSAAPKDGCNGDDASKATCLWLKGLPALEKVNPLEKVRYANQTPSGQNRLGPSPDRWKLRSLTGPGFAAAMADRWGILYKESG